MKLIACLIAPLACLSLSVAAADKKNLFDENAPTVDWMAYSSTPTQEVLAVTANLGDLAKKEAVMGTNGSALGFAQKSPEARFFLAGSLYAEALALTQSGEYEEADKRLAALISVCKQLAITPALEHYLKRMRQMVSAQSHDRASLVDMLALAQPLLDDFAGSQSEDKRFLFQTGAWLVDMSLASASGNTMLLKQPVRIGQTLRRMQSMEAPKGVLEALGEIQKIAEKGEIGKSDAKRAQQLVRKIQDILG
jgi:hypothetical protein